MEQDLQATKSTESELSKILSQELSTEPSTSALRRRVVPSTTSTPEIQTATAVKAPWPTKHAAVFENLDPQTQAIVKKFVFMDVNKVEDEDLYIGSMFSLRKHAQLEELGITHILSVLGIAYSEEVKKKFKTLKINVDDVEEENLIEHFATTNQFIQDALDGGGKVYIHCAMGKSRSATVLCAYLVYKHKITPDLALAQVRKTRPLCEPNSGFWEQLQLYYANLEQAIKNLDDVPAYQRFIYNQEIKLAKYEHRAPRIAFYDADVDPNTATSQGTSSGTSVTTGSPEATYRCKRCRRVLATSRSIITHEPLQSGGVLSIGKDAPPANPLQPCAHHFLEPVEWMRPELEKGELEGKLDCPKCNSKVGSYVWHGMKCSCSRWIVPGLSLARSKVDEIKSRPAPAVAASSL